MAVISKGQVLLTGDPLKTIAELQGKIWKKIIRRQELPEYEKNFRIISTHLIAGKTVIHVYSDTSPDPEFQSVTSDLEDVYFSTLRSADVVGVPAHV